MINTKWAGIVAGVAGLTLSIQAQTETQTETPTQPTQPPPTQTYNAPEESQTTPPPEGHWEHYEHLYHGDELSVDLFGVGTLHSSYFHNGELARRNLQFGGGAGVNYFLTRHLGIGGDFFALSFKRSFVDTTTGNLIFRLPIADTGLAPYIFAGAGYQFQGIDQIVGGGGAGLEFRPCPHFGIFVDARYLAAVKTRDYGVGRAGIRLSF